MYVNMDVCTPYVGLYAYVCEFVCSMARRTRRRQRNGQMEARRRGNAI